MTKVLLLLVLILAARESSAGIKVVYDFVDHFTDARIVNAMNAGAGSSKAGGVQKRSLGLHPITGETTATYEVSLPQIKPDERLILVMSAGISDGIKLDEPEHPFDGVSFAVRVDGNERFAANLKETKWIDRSIDLTSIAGKQVEIVFVTKPNSNSNYDWAAFGDPRILKLSSPVAIKTNMAPISKGVIVAETVEPIGIEIVPVDTSGNKMGDGLSVSSPAGEFAAIQFDFTKLRPAGVKIIRKGKVDVAVYKFDPQLEIVSFGPANAFVFADAPTEFRCVVRNVGEGTQDTSVDAKLSVSTSQSVGPLLPREEKILTWQGIKFPAGEAAASLTMSGLTANWSGMAVKLPPMPPKAQTAGAKRLADGTIVLQNPVFRMVFPKSKSGYAGWIISVPKETEWQTAATGSFGKLVTPGQTINLYPSEVKTPGVLAVVFTGKALDCEFEWTFTMDSSQPKVSASSAITTEKPVEMLHFSGPMVYAGDGSFGSAKDGGLFPGLEYLLTERSSGTENAGPPYNLRTVPHPNKVTIPFMAVRKGGTLVSLEWDPLQRWDGVNDRPAAVFASPNFLDGQENHLMGLFAPSVPDWTMENKQVASKPYPLDAGKSLRLTADIIVRSDSMTILDAVDGWISRHALPEPPETGKKSYEVMSLFNEAYSKSCWDPGVKAWKHTNTSSGSFDPMIAVYLRDQINHLTPPMRASIEPIYNAAMDQTKDQLPGIPPLASLGVVPALGDWADVTALARPAVVFIRHRDTSGQESTGTGFLASSDGLIVTCAHVVAPLEADHNGKRVTRDRIWVRFYDNSTAEATTLSCDTLSDIAVISIAVKDRPYLHLNTELPKLAEEVCVIGYPLGDALGKGVSVTKGIVSALREGNTIYQIDAAANPGSSGAPVLDKDGDVIGIVSFKFRGTEGMSFAISASQVSLTRNKAREEIPKGKPDESVSGVADKRPDINLDVALLAGGVEGALKRMADHANGLIASQRADGSWPFTPDEKHAVFGKSGDSASGHSAIYAETVLRYAVISGNAKARDAGLKALGYLDTQSRPEGAQTWELQLHVPDILASARLINCYLYGYQMTDNKKYLDRAIYWAKSGLPFVYLWNADDRPIMRYGTIPVLGVTWFTSQPWFGVCVQWCGLEYANSLLRLSDLDKSQPWDKIARGILNCGIQQQLYITEKYPSDAGMYPDAYSPIKGAEEYHWDLNPRLISRIFPRLHGRDAFPNTYIITDRRGTKLALTLPLKDVHLRYDQEFLKGDFLGVPGATLYGLVTGVRDPASVQFNQRLIPADDLDAVESGFRYYPETRVTIVKFKSGLENALAIDLLYHNSDMPKTQGE